MIVTAVPLVTMRVFAEPILRVADTAAESSTATLRILAIGQAVHVVVGPVGPLLLARR